MARILISGASGFVGRHLTRRLMHRHEIVGLVRRVPDDRGGLDIEWCVQDLREPLRYGNLPDRIDAVIHLAQSRRYKSFPEEAEDIFRVNVQSAFNLLEYARRVGAERFILASSGGIYGYGYEKLVETDRVNPLNFYFTSKYTAELLLANYRPFLHTVVLRLFFVFGAKQRDMLIPRLLERVRRGAQITVEGDPGLRINPVHVTDVARAFEAALALQGSDVLNIAGDEIVTITDLLQLMGEVAGRRPIIQYADSKIEGDLIGENARMKDVLGVRPTVSLLEGLREMAREPFEPGR